MGHAGVLPSSSGGEGPPVSPPGGKSSLSPVSKSFLPPSDSTPPRINGLGVAAAFVLFFVGFERLSAIPGGGSRRGRASLANFVGKTYKTSWLEQDPGRWRNRAGSGEAAWKKLLPPLQSVRWSAGAVE